MSIDEELLRLVAENNFLQIEMLELRRKLIEYQNKSGEGINYIEDPKISIQECERESS